MKYIGPYLGCRSDSKARRSLGTAIPGCERRGSVYVAVLGVALIVAVIGISSLHVARLEVRESVALDEMSRARNSARSGIECVLATLKANALWRTTYVSGTTNSLAHLAGPLAGDDSFQFVLRDTDGNLADNPDDPVTIRCVGTAGNARHVIEVMLAPSGEGLSSLSAALHADGDITANAVMTTNQYISSNDDISSSGGSIQGNAQAVDNISGGVTGNRRVLNPALEMPDPNSVFEYYRTVGTWITFSQIPSGAIDKVVLSSTYNPYGSQLTNQQGIYVIDCQGNNLIIRNSRINATLVLINAGPLTSITNSVNWEHAVANFPALLVQGSLTMNWTQQINLSESTTGANFNPVHTPYLGSSDLASDGDSYPSIIKGLVYTTGNLYISNPASLEGVTVVGGAVFSTSASNFNYKSIYLGNAPPGFTSGNNMKLVPGTWKQVAY